VRRTMSWPAPTCARPIPASSERARSGGGARVGVQQVDVAACVLG
jgi:hypothetical protein